MGKLLLTYWLICFISVSIVIRKDSGPQLLPAYLLVAIFSPIVAPIMVINYLSEVKI